MKTILVVDDEPQIVQLVRDYLEHGGFKVLVAADGSSALRIVSTLHPDLVVLDLGLPGMDGLDVTRSLRRNGALPIVMLTARADESDKLVGLELGADDYLVKPFSPKELVARVRSVLRRSEAAQAPRDLIRVGELELNLPSLQLTIAGRPVELTQTEFQLLSTMARQPGRVFSRAQLLNAIHGVEVESYERAIDAHVKNLRRKIEPEPHNPRYLAEAGADGDGPDLPGAARDRRPGGRREKAGRLADDRPGPAPGVDSYGGSSASWSPRSS